MRCSTVTPGKLATFWRSPVRRLNRVDLPELGGPMIAMTAAFDAAGGGKTETEDSQSWQSLICDSAISVERRFPGARRIPSRPHGKRVGRRPAPNERRRCGLRAGIPAPSAAEPDLPANPDGPGRHVRPGEARKARLPA